MSVLQDIAAIQIKSEAAHRELRKTQQLLRQLERQLAKAHMSRKEAGSTSQRLQVAFHLAIASAVLPCPLQISSHAMSVSGFTAGVQQVVVQSCLVDSVVARNLTFRCIAGVATPQGQLGEAAENRQARAQCLGSHIATAWLSWQAEQKQPCSPGFQPWAAAEGAS